MAVELDFVSQAELREIINLYFEVKGLVALAELNDEEQRLCIPAIIELRNALDHLMRIGHVCVNSGRDDGYSSLVVGDDPRPKVPENKQDQDRYCEINFSKIKGHLFRAAYDALDVLVLSALKEFQYLVRSPDYDFDDICKAIPSWPEQAAKVDLAKKLVTRCKMYKDVVGDKEAREDINREVMEQYLGAYRDVKRASRLIREHSLDIRAAVKRRKRQTRKTILISLVTSVIATIVIASGVWLSRFLPFSKSAPDNIKIYQEKLYPNFQKSTQSTAHQKNARDE